MSSSHHWPYRFTFLMFLAAQPLAARAQEFPEFSDSIQQRFSNREDPESYDHRGFNFNFDAVMRDEKKRPYVYHMRLVRAVPGGKPIQYGPFSRGEWAVYFPHLYFSDLVPMTGRVVGVSWLNAGNAEDNWSGSQISLKVLPDELVPEDIRPAPGSFCIPLRGSATLRSDVILIRDLVPDMEPNALAVEVVVTNVWDWKIDGFSRATKRLVFDKRRLFLRPGELIFLGGRLYPALRIIPRDPDRQVIGWLELGPPQELE